MPNKFDEYRRYDEIKAEAVMEEFCPITKPNKNGYYFLIGGDEYSANYMYLKYNNLPTR